MNYNIVDIGLFWVTLYNFITQPQHTTLFCSNTKHKLIQIKKSSSEYYSYEKLGPYFICRLQSYILNRNKINRSEYLERTKKTFENDL